MGKVYLSRLKKCIVLNTVKHTGYPGERNYYVACKNNGQNIMCIELCMLKHSECMSVI